MKTIITIFVIIIIIIIIIIMIIIIIIIKNFSCNERSTPGYKGLYSVHRNRIKGGAK